ncbi:transcription-repair coupling factor [Helicobacter sp. T3_23-1056]
MLQANLYKHLKNPFAYRILLVADEKEARQAFELARFAHANAQHKSSQDKPNNACQNLAHTSATTTTKSTSKNPNPTQNPTQNPLQNPLQNQTSKSQNLTQNPLAPPTQNLKSQNLKQDFATILPPVPLLLPEARFGKNEDLRSFYTEFLQILAVLRDFYERKDTLLIAPIYSLLYALPAHKYLQHFAIEVGQRYDLEELKSRLVCYGYEAVEVIEMEGEASFRGDIIDIYPPLARPYRISFFDDECEDIRVFDCATQLSEKDTNLKSINIPPALFALDSSEFSALQESIDEAVANDTPNDSSDNFSSIFSKDILSCGLWFLGKAGLDSFILPQKFSSIFTPNALNELAEILSVRKDLDNFWHSAKSTLPCLKYANDYTDIDFYPASLAPIITHNAHKKITLLCDSEAILSALNIDELKSINQHIEILPINATVHCATPSEIILSLNPAQTHTKTRKKPKLQLDELNIGEYVVHSEYGIGIFRGIVQDRILGAVRDFIAIDYQGEDKLFLPVENLHLIERYIASSGSLPIVDRLGKGSFAKLKQKARIKLFELADSIIKLAATRNLTKGIAIDTKNPELALFRHSSGFTLTLDQENAIDEIYKDLASGVVMDRLLSGDVGFGKTEVAMNAIFAVQKSGFQSAFIVPTTLLASQHFASLDSRLSPLGIKVARLDRFCSTKQKREVLSACKNGQIDVLIGTHSAFGAEFERLGLVVIDEEHKFGVKQKEGLKKICKNAHILSMSATPIPRTLNMALSKIKGLSRLEIPPKERKDSRTFIKTKSDALLKEIINREIRRGGQVFYVHNNIAQIPSLKSELEGIFPHLAIAVLHSQISANDTEEIMRDFLLKKYHILLCTAIVESGIHLPNANTIIIDGADRFGLADLHQLRGRVGRGDKEGFCYFLIEGIESITKEATKRLLALERNSYLGSGASIAYHDLEIRGGGNLLGESQSGHIKNIGLSLYLKMLEEAINALSGGKIDEDEKKGVELRLNVSAYLNPELIPSDRLRLEIYRRLSLCEEVGEVAEIEREIEDRFGRLDEMSRAFLQLIVIKILAKNKGVAKILHYEQNIQVEFRESIKSSDSTKSMDSSADLSQSSRKISLKSPSKDDDDVLESILVFLRQA